MKFVLFTKHRLFRSDRWKGIPLSGIADRYQLRWSQSPPGSINRDYISVLHFFTAPSRMGYETDQRECTYSEVIVSEPPMHLVVV